MGSVAGRGKSPHGHTCLALNLQQERPKAGSQFADCWMKHRRANFLISVGVLNPCGNSERLLPRLEISVTNALTADSRKTESAAPIRALVEEACLCVSFELTPQSQGKSHSD